MGHKGGLFGHEFLEFEFRPGGALLTQHPAAHTRHGCPPHPPPPQTQTQTHTLPPGGSRQDAIRQQHPVQSGQAVARFAGPLLARRPLARSPAAWQCYVGPAVLAEIKRVIEDSQVIKEDDSLWPVPDRVWEDGAGGCAP